MSNVMTIARRELAQTFRSPLAYVFLVLFIVLAQAMYILGALPSGQANLRFFLDLLPIWVVLFSALITMRAWAEDRAANTYEMLLTFPMKDHELVLGKFVASFLFMSGGVLCTLALPAMVFLLGDPDPGPIATGYVGALLTIAMWTSIGVFFSSLSRTQLMAAIVTIVLGLLSLALGTDFVTLLLEARAPGVGQFLGSVFGTWGHYSPFTRGVIELSDVAYFLTWTAAFLYLNVLSLRRSRRAVEPLVSGVAIALTVGCGLLGARLFHDTSLARADLTEEGLYTLSDGTVNILKRAEAPVRATLYITAREDMPPDYKNLEQEVLDRLDEMRAATGGLLAVRVLHPQAANLVIEPEESDDTEVSLGDDAKMDEDATADGEEKERKERVRTIERRLMEKGVQPFEVQTVEATETSSKLIFATLGLAYREKDEEFIQPLAQQTLGQLEYNIAQTVSRLVRDEAPKIALYLGPEPIEPWMKQQYERAGVPIPDPYSQVADFLRGEKLDVQRVALTAHEPLPEDYDALVMIGPTQLNDRQRWELNRALVSGKPTLVAVQRYRWKYPDSRSGGIALEKETIDPGLGGVLSENGIRVSDAILMDENHIALSFRTGDIRDLMGGKRVPAPMHVEIKEDGLSDESVLTDRLQSVLYLWGTSLELDPQQLSSQGLAPTVLARSGLRSWQVPDLRRRADLQFPGPEIEENRVPLVAQVKGQFADAYAGKERPEWPFELKMGPQGRPLPAPPDPPATPLEPKPGLLFVTGSAQMWGNGLLTAFDNGDLLLNLIDALRLDDDLLKVRSKEPRMRRLDKPTPTEALLFWLLPTVVVPGVIVVFGLAIGFRRMQAREAWNARHGR